MFDHVQLIYLIVITLLDVMLLALDDALGEIVERLEETGMMENTVLIYSSDNGGQALVGGASNYPLRGNKATYYEAGQSLCESLWKNTTPNNISSVRWYFHSI